MFLWPLQISLILLALIPFEVSALCPYPRKWVTLSGQDRIRHCNLSRNILCPSGSSCEDLWLGLSGCCTLKRLKDDSTIFSEDENPSHTLKRDESLLREGEETDSLEINESGSLDSDLLTGLSVSEILGSELESTSPAPSTDSASLRSNNVRVFVPLGAEDWPEYSDAQNLIVGPPEDSAGLKEKDEKEIGIQEKVINEGTTADPSDDEPLLTTEPNPAELEISEELRQNTPQPSQLSTHSIPESTTIASIESATDKSPDGTDEKNSEITDKEENQAKDETSEDTLGKNDLSSKSEEEEPKNISIGPETTTRAFDGFQEVNQTLEGFPPTRVLIFREGKAEQVTNGQFRLPSTVTLIQDSGRNIIIDTGIPTDVEMKSILIKSLKDKGLEPSDVHYVVTTHGHPDHFGNVNLFPDAVQYFAGWMYFGTTFTFTDLFASKSIPLTSNVRIYRTPGHTPQDISVVIRTPSQETVAVVGDLFIAEEDIDFPDMWEPLAWNVEIQKKNRRKIICDADIIIPGHGHLFYVTELLREKFQCFSDDPNLEADYNGIE